MERTVEELNTLPINERAKEMLIMAGEKPDSGSLYCVQLAIWGIEKKNMDTEDGIKEFINAMTTWRASRLMNFFMLPYEKEEKSFNWEEKKTPEELARTIIEYIEYKIAIHFPLYFAAD